MTEKTKIREICNSRVTDYKIGRKLYVRSVKHDGKKMLFFSDIKDKLSGFDAKKLITQNIVKSVNVTTCLPGVRYLVDAEAFKEAYDKHLTQEVETLRAPTPQKAEPEQFTLKLDDVVQVTIESGNEQVSLPSSNTGKLDFNKLRAFATSLITKEEAKHDKFLIAEPVVEAKDANVRKPKTNEKSSEDTVRQGIIAAVDNYIAKRCRLMDDRSAEYREVKQKTWLSLLTNFYGVVESYFVEKYKQPLESYDLGLDTINKIKPENYLLRLMDFDRDHNEQLLKMLQDTSDVCFNIRRNKAN
jgi:hypothetical protein